MGGFRPSDGFFGHGVYLTSSLNKAWAWAKYRASCGVNIFFKNQRDASYSYLETHRPVEPKGAVVLAVKVHDLGKCKQLDMRKVKDSDYEYRLYHACGNALHSIAKKP